MHETRIITAGTLRIEDLLRAYADELARISGNHASKIQEARDVAEDLDTNPIATEDDFEEAHWLLEELHDALNAQAPEGYYFGTDPNTPDEKGWFSVHSFCSPGWCEEAEEPNSRCPANDW